MNIQQTILAYIFGTLPNADKAEWESNLLHNPALKTDIKTLRNVFSERNITSIEAYETLEKERKQQEIEEYLQTIERIIRRIKHRDFTVAYLEGDVSQPEMVAFEEEVRQNPELQKQVQEMKAIAELFKMAKHRKKAEEVWAYIQAEEKKGSHAKEEKAQTKSSRPLWQRLMSLAAAILVLAVVSWGLWSLLKPNQNYDNEYFASTYFAKPYPISGYMGKADKLAEITQDYKESKYELVIQQLEDNKFTSTDAQMMQANSYMKLQKWDNAILILEEIEKNNQEEIPLINNVRYYLGLSYLFKGEKDKALAIFEGIKSQKDSLKVQADIDKLIQEIKESKK